VQAVCYTAKRSRPSADLNATSPSPAKAAALEQRDGRSHALAKRAGADLPRSPGRPARLLPRRRCLRRRAPRVRRAAPRVRPPPPSCVSRLRRATLSLPASAGALRSCTPQCGITPNKCPCSTAAVHTRSNVCRSSSKWSAVQCKTWYGQLYASHKPPGKREAGGAPLA